MTDRAEAERPLRLYKYTDGSVSYWVAAHAARDVAGLVEAADGVGSIELEQFEVFSVTKEQGAKTKLTCDGEPDSNMRAELLKATKPVVLGCSEWP